MKKLSVKIKGYLRGIIEFFIICLVVFVIFPIVGMFFFDESQSSDPNSFSTAVSAEYGSVGSYFDKNYVKEDNFYLNSFSIAFKDMPAKISEPILVNALTKVEADSVIFNISGPKQASVVGERNTALSYVFDWNVGDFPDGAYKLEARAIKGEMKAFAVMDVIVAKTSASSSSATSTTAHSDGSGSQPKASSSPLTTAHAVNITSVSATPSPISVKLKPIAGPVSGKTIITILPNIEPDYVILYLNSNETGLSNTISPLKKGLFEYVHAWDTLKSANGKYKISAYVKKGSASARDQIEIEVKNAGSSLVPLSIEFPKLPAVVTGALKLSFIPEFNPDYDTVNVYFSGTDSMAGRAVRSGNTFYYLWDTIGYADGEYTVSANAERAGKSVSTITQTVTVNNSVTTATSDDSSVSSGDSVKSSVDTKSLPEPVSPASSRPATALHIVQPASFTEINGPADFLIESKGDVSKVRVVRYIGTVSVMVGEASPTRVSGKFFWKYRIEPFTFSDGSYEFRAVGVVNGKDEIGSDLISLTLSSQIKKPATTASKEESATSSRAEKPIIKDPDKDIASSAPVTVASSSPANTGNSEKEKPAVPEPHTTAKTDSITQKADYTAVQETDNLDWECRYSGKLDRKECDNFHFLKNLPYACKQEKILSTKECEDFLRSKAINGECSAFPSPGICQKSAKIPEENPDVCGSVQILECRSAVGSMLADSGFYLPTQKQNTLNMLLIDEECERGKKNTIQDCAKYLISFYLPAECVQEKISDPKLCRETMRKRYGSPEECKGASPSECEKIVSLNAPLSVKQIAALPSFPQDCRNGGILSFKQCELHLREKYATDRCYDKGFFIKTECKKHLFEEYGLPEACKDYSDRECEKLIDEVILGRFIEKNLSAQQSQAVATLSGKSIKITQAGSSTLLLILDKDKITELAESLKKTVLGLLPFEPELSGNRVSVLATRESIAGYNDVLPATFVQDLDGDGIPDEIESRIGTDPQSVDTDKDGFSDIIELRSGYDPLGPGKKNFKLSSGEKALISGVSLEQPINSGISASDILEINSKEGNAILSGTSSTLRFSGRALPGQQVFLYIYSPIPIMISLSADQNGNWNHELKAKLKDGKHEAYLAYLDDHGNIIAKSEESSFFIKSAKASSLGDLIKISDASHIINERKGNIFWYIAGFIALLLAVISAYLVKRLVRK